MGDGTAEARLLQALAQLDGQADAAVLAAANIADEYFKAVETAEHLREQLAGYLEEATRAKNEISELKREIFKLQNQR